MHARPHIALLPTALLAAGLSLAGLPGSAWARPVSANKQGAPQPDKGASQFGGMNSPDAAKQRLDQVTNNFSRLQSLASLQNSPDAVSQLWGIQEMINKAREGLAAGNNVSVFEICAQIDKRIGELFFKEKNRVRAENRWNSGPGGGTDSNRIREDLQAQAEIDYERAVERFASLSQRLGSGKNPCAAEVLGKVKILLDKAQLEIGAQRAASSRIYLTQAEALTPDLQRLTQESANSEKQGSSALAHGACNDQQPSAQAALAQASDTYHSLQERYTRLTEQSSGSDDAKSATVKARIQDFLDKAKEALANGQPEAAKEFCLKGEGLLPDLRKTVSGTGSDRLTPAAWQRLKAKLDRAAEIVASSGNDKAAKILDKGQEHLERAQHNQADGQAARAEVEMEIALKLAAKAVDIARSSGR